MSKFREFFLAEISMGTYGSTGFSGSKDKLGGTLNLPNIHAQTQPGRNTGFANAEDWANRQNALQAYDGKYKGDKRLSMFSVGEVETALGTIAQITNQMYELIRTGQAQGNVYLHYKLKNGSNITNGYAQASGEKIIGMAPQAFYGQHGVTTDPTWRVGYALGIFQKNTTLQNAVDSSGRPLNLIDVDAALLRKEINNAIPYINSTKQGMDIKRGVAAGVDKIMQRSVQSQGGVQPTASNNAFTLAR